MSDRKSFMNLQSLRRKRILYRIFNLLLKKNILKQLLKLAEILKRQLVLRYSDILADFCKESLPKLKRNEEQRLKWIHRISGRKALRKVIKKVP